VQDPTENKRDAKDSFYEEQRACIWSIPQVPHENPIRRYQHKCRERNLDTTRLVLIWHSSIYDVWHFRSAEWVTITWKFKKLETVSKHKILIWWDLISKCYTVWKLKGYYHGKISNRIAGLGSWMMWMTVLGKVYKRI